VSTGIDPNVTKGFSSLFSHLGLLCFCERPLCHDWSWDHFLSSYKFDFCSEVLLSATPALGGFLFSYPPIETHRRICNQPNWLRKFSAGWTQYVVPWPGWTESCVRLSVLLRHCPSFLPSLPTCVMYYIDWLSLSRYRIVSLQRFPLCPSLLSPLRPLLPSVGFPIHPTYRELKMRIRRVGD